MRFSLQQQQLLLLSSMVAYPIILPLGPRHKRERGGSGLSLVALFIILKYLVVVYTMATRSTSSGQIYTHKGRGYYTPHRDTSTERFSVCRKQQQLPRIDPSPSAKTEKLAVVDPPPQKSRQEAGLFQL